MSVPDRWVEVKGSLNKPALPFTLMLCSVNALPAAAQEFCSPFGNILSLFYAPVESDATYTLRCEIIEHRKSFNTPPADCNIDWQGLFFPEKGGKAMQGCAGDVGGTDKALVLGYGEIIQQGGRFLPDATGRTDQHQPRRPRLLHAARRAMAFLGRAGLYLRDKHSARMLRIRLFNIPHP